MVSINGAKEILWKVVILLAAGFASLSAAIVGYTVVKVEDCIESIQSIKVELAITKTHVNVLRYNNKADRR